MSDTQRAEVGDRDCVDYGIDLAARLHVEGHVRARVRDLWQADKAADATVIRRPSPVQGEGPGSSPDVGRSGVPLEDLGEMPDIPAILRRA